MQVLVRDNNVDQTMKALKRKLQREGVLRELKARRHYQSSERRALKAQGAVRRGGEVARKQAERRGLIVPRKKPEPRPRRAAVFPSTSNTASRT